MTDPRCQRPAGTYELLLRELAASGSTEITSLGRGAADPA